jgi:[protein-PII] uridylyltransferase
MNAGATSQRSLMRPPPWRIETVVDGRKLRTLLTAAALDNLSDPAAQRARALDLIHSALFRGRIIAQDRLEEGADGVDTARLLSAVMDEALAALYDFTTIHIFRAHNPTDSERMAVLAVGGYGRGVLAPSSDVDLLFLRNFRQTAWAESVIEYMLYALWDMGLKVGHAFRTVEECIRLSREDTTIRTAVLDGRFLFGDRATADKLAERFQREVVAGRGSEFVAAKLAERDRRHEREGGSRYRVEPNVKDGKGGLRDLQTLYWIAKYIHGGRTLEDVLERAQFSAQDRAVYMREARFLWTVRCHMHFLTGRPEERLSFDLQPEMAERMGYTGRQNVTAVERFMKRYFLAAKEVGALTRILCAKLEADEKKRPAPLSVRFLPQPSARSLKEPGFVLDGGRLSIASADVFERSPVNMIRLFQIAGRREADIHPDAMTAARRSLSLMTRSLRYDAEARSLFLDMLVGPGNPARQLSLMNEAGVLGRFLPEFGRIVGQTQFNMYHHFTVDEHTLKAVETIHEIGEGVFSSAHPLSTELFWKIQNRRALYLAMLLHDTGKGKGDQQVEGAKAAYAASIRLGIEEEEAQLVSWLVGNHLEMSDTAQRRDISDPSTVSQFAQKVGTIERLRLLLILTVADIRAVGPGVWNGWKGQLLRDLYYATEAALRGGRTDQASLRSQLAQRALEAKAALEALAGRTARLTSVEDAYWVQFSTEAHARHAAALEAETSDIAVAAHIRPERSATEILVFAPDRPGLFADLCGALSGSGGNVAAAHLYQSGDGRVLDVFDVQDAGGAPFGADHPMNLDRMLAALRLAAHGGEGLKTPGKPPAASRRLAAFIIPPIVRIDRSASADHTVLEVSGRDRPGLLYDIARELVSAGISIRSAHVGAYGERVHDVFYIETVDGGDLPQDQDAQLIARLEAVLRVNAPSAPRIPAHTLKRATASNNR